LGDLAEQQRSEPGLLGKGHIGAEDPQILPQIEPQDHQVLVVGLNEHERHVGGRVHVAQGVGDVLDVGGVAQRHLVRGPLVGGSDDRRGEVGHVPPGRLSHTG
jgi:hypothetical protein